MQGITPFLWFEDKAEEAAAFYVSVFNNSRIQKVSRYEAEGAEVSGRPVGSAMTVAFELEGQEFVALNGGPVFKFTPAISFFVSCQTPEEFDPLWERLSEGGATLMERDAYPFSPRFGWFVDRFGVSWQLNLVPRDQKIAPFLMFVGDQHGKAQEAINRYVSLFENSRIVSLTHYGPGEVDPEGTVKHAAFCLDGQEFMAIDSGWEHPFGFTPAISFLVNCETQAEVDKFWDNLTAGGKPGQCGWLEDKFGVSWQIVPTILSELLGDPEPSRSQRAMKAMLQMSKLDIEGLKKAANSD